MRCDAIPDVVAYAVVRGKRAGQQRDVGRKRERHVRPRAGEEDAVAAERVDVRRLDGLVSEEREVIGAQRVDGDDDHRRAGEVADRRQRALGPVARRKKQGRGGCRDSEGPHAWKKAQSRAANFGGKKKSSERVPEREMEAVGG